MQIITVSVEAEDVKNKILWFLEHLKNEGVEIISQEDASDLRSLMATRGEKSISFSEYLQNENSH